MSFIQYLSFFYPLLCSGLQSSWCPRATSRARRSRCSSSAARAETWRRSWTRSRPSSLRAKRLAVSASLRWSDCSVADHEEHLELVSYECLLQIWKKKEYLKPMCISLVLMALQQLSGINYVLSYSQEIFKVHIHKTPFDQLIRT